MSIENITITNASDLGFQSQNYRVGIDSSYQQAMKNKYTQHYMRESAESPPSSRNFLIERIIFNCRSLLNQPNSLYSETNKVKVMSLGAGPGLLESELAVHSNWHEVSSKVSIVAFDLATVEALDSPAIHIQANALQTPFADKTFDIIDANLSIDYAGREALFEIARILKPDGKLVANFNHPAFKNIAENHWCLLREEARVNRDLMETVKKDSPRWRRYKTSMQEAMEEIADPNLQFFLNVFHTFTFQSLNEIYTYFSNNFEFTELITEEISCTSHTGWFYVEAQGLQKRDFLQTAAAD